MAFFDNIFNRNQFEYMQLCVFNLDNLKHITLSDQILTLLSPKQKIQLASPQRVIFLALEDMFALNIEIK